MFSEFFIPISTLSLISPLLTITLSESWFAIAISFELGLTSTTFLTSSFSYSIPSSQLKEK
jgi:hypothetical protein